MGLGTRLAITAGGQREHAAEDLDLPEQHPVLEDSYVTLRRKKSSYTLERAGTSLADRFLATFYPSILHILTSHQSPIIAHPGRALIYAVAEKVCLCLLALRNVMCTYMCANVCVHVYDFCIFSCVSVRVSRGMVYASLCMCNLTRAWNV